MTDVEAPEPPSKDPVKNPDEGLIPPSVVQGIIYGFVIVLFLYLLYSLYVSWQKGQEPYINEQPRDDPAADFNLRKAIADLKKLQNDIVSRLSTSVDI